MSGTKITGAHVIGVYVGDYLYGKTTYIYKTYSSAERKVKELRSKGYKSIIILTKTEEFQIWAV